MRKSRATASKIFFNSSGNLNQYNHWGWSASEGTHTWSSSHHAGIELPLSEIQNNLFLYVDGSPLTGPNLSYQFVIVLINNRTVTKNPLIMGTNDNELRIPIPSEFLLNGTNTIEFFLPNATSPYSLGLSDDERTLALAVRSIVITDSTEPVYHEYVFGNKILFGENGTAGQYQLDGWSHPEEGFSWTDGHRSVLGFKTSNTDSDLNMTITASPFTSQQMVNVTVNDHQVGELIFNKPEGQEESIIIPHDVLNEGVQYITFNIPNAKSPLSLGLSDDGRTLGLAIRSIQIIPD